MFLTSPLAKILPLASLIVTVTSACAIGGTPEEDQAAQTDPIVKASAYGDKLVWSYSQPDSYTPLPWTLFKPTDFAPLPDPFDGTGVTSVGDLPPSGVHPRIFFSREDIPALRQRFKESKAAQIAWRNVICFCNALKLTYDEKADYAQPDLQKGNFGAHGPILLMRIGGYKNREDYFTELAQGQRPKSNFMWYQGMVPEAFRCLIEDDAVGGKKVAAAVTTAVQIDNEGWGEHAKFSADGKPPHLVNFPPRGNGMGLRDENEAVGMLYDFAYNWMTPEQRQIVHDSLVLRSAWEDNYGTFNDAETSRSNFATFSHFVLDSMAIEGESGFNDLKLRGVYRGWRNFYSTSFFKSGAIFEGEGKSLLGMDSCVAFSRCAKKYGWEPLTWHPTPQHHFGTFEPMSMDPSQDGFVKFDLLGGVNSDPCKPDDLMIAHYLYPNNKALDFVYRTVVGDDYENVPNAINGPQNDVILSALYATDYDPQNTPEKIGLPNTFFCGQRAMMISRSGWEKDASLLTFHERGASGGHPYRDRNGIMFAGKGRPWITIPTRSGEVNGWRCNTVQIDGCEPNNSTPGRVVDFQDNPNATFIVGDSKYSWDWSWLRVNKTRDDQFVTRDRLKSGEPLDFGPAMKPVTQCFNDFAYTKIHTPEYDRPLKEEPDWIHLEGYISPYLRMVNTPVLKSFRTAGIVRGPHPYAIIVDDFQRDAFPAKYNWNLTLMPDVVAAKDPGLLQGDLLVSGQDSLNPDGSIKPGAPALLIRPLDVKGHAQIPHLEVRETDLAPNQKTRSKAPFVVFSTVAPSPDFKVMLYAFRQGEPLPFTSPLGSQHMTVQFPDQSDQLVFSASDSGKTNVTVTRNGETLVAMDKPVPSLNDPDSDALTASLRELPAKVDQARAWDPGQIPGLVASWPLNAISTNGLSADQPEVPAFGAQGATIEETSIGKAARFDSDGGLAPFKSIGKLANPCSFSFWAKSDKGPNEHLLNIGDFGMEIIQGSMWVSASHQINFARPIAVGMLEDWTHYAVVMEGDKVTMYCNGRLLFSKEGDRPFQPGNDVKLGQKFNGVFKDLRIYNTALDADTVRKLYIKGYYLSSTSSLQN